MTYLTQPSGLPYDFPDFSKVTPDLLRDSVRAGIKAQEEAVAAIVNNTDEPTFANTFEAFELSSEGLHRAAAVAFHLFSADATEPIQAVEAEITAMVAAHQDAMTLYPGLYARMQQVDAGSLEGEQARLVEVTMRSFRASGAELDAEGQEKLKALNAQLTDLQTEFGRLAMQNLVDAAPTLTEAEATGLSPARLEATRHAAQAAGADGHRISLVLPTVQPDEAILTTAEGRKKLHEASSQRASDGKSSAIAAQIAALRVERARLLGFETHAEEILSLRSETSVSAINDLLAQLAKPALANAAAEDARIAEALGLEPLSSEVPVAPWDRARGLSLVGSQSDGVDAELLQQHLELETVLTEGVFRAAGLVYGLSFTERNDLPLPHPDARIWEVFEENGDAIGLFVGDFFARDTKRGGAWMNELAQGASAANSRPIICNTLNIPKPTGGNPALCTWDEVITLFHEFGHALHGLLSAAEYPSLAGTNVGRDIVEFPSQVNEMWAVHPEVLPHYTKHAHTGEPLPADQIEKLTATSTWGEGFSTSEYLAASILDLAWHQRTGTDVEADPAAFEDSALREAGFNPDSIESRYKTGYFQHIFAGGYSAGYYCYIWSEILDADAVEWFKEQEDIRAAGQLFREEFLSRGNTRDALESYRAFRGRDARIDPLLERRGLKA